MPGIAETLAAAEAQLHAGDFSGAEPLCRQVLAAQPENAEAHYLLGAATYRLGRTDEAIVQLREAVRLKPDFGPAHNHLGVLLIATGHVDEAVASFQQACHYDPTSPEAADNLLRAQAAQAMQRGTQLANARKLDQAALCFRRATELVDDPAAHNNLGVVLQALGKTDAALACFRRALELNADYAESLTNLGAALDKEGRAAEAEPWLRRAVALVPEAPDVHHNLAVALHTLGKLDEALAEFDRALQLQPNHVGAHVARGVLLLLRGQFAEGWRDFEWRRKRGPVVDEAPPELRWTGEDLAGRTILLVSEEGLGDTLQFVRFATVLARQGARVIVECPPPLSRLLASCPGVERVIVAGEPRPRFDVWTPLLSVPLCVGTSQNDLPAEIPYLSPPVDLVDRWKAELGGERQFKIGIAWQGNRMHRADRYRSIPLAEFAPLAAVPGVRMYSLQFGEGRTPLAEVMPRWPITDLGDRLGDFENTAAIMRNLDLVVSCDSAAAHLAGALGVRVWTALTFTPDWRWLLERADSPWYPTMRLFRQQRLGDWSSVFRPMERELKQLLARRESA